MPIGKAPTAVADKPLVNGESEAAPARRTLGGESPASNGDSKGRRILVQGITQAVVQSPIVASLSNFTTPEHITDLVKKVSRELIAFVESES